MFAATVLAVGPFLPAPAAHADDASQDGGTGTQTVDFVGGSVLTMLMCRSEPSAGRLTIPAESRVMFVNRLGQDAALRVNGKAMAQVGPDEAAPVVFHRGPVSISMTFPCGTGVVEHFGSTTVAVTALVPPAPPRSLTPVPRPTVSPTVGPTRTPPAGPRTSRSARGALSSAQEAGTALATVTADPPVASRSSAPAAPVPAAPINAALAAADTLPDTVAGADAVAVQPLVRMASTTRDDSSGLLAVVAAACAVCVTIAVIRAIITKPNKPSALRVR